MEVKADDRALCGVLVMLPINTFSFEAASGQRGGIACRARQISKARPDKDEGDAGGEEVDRASNARTIVSKMEVPLRTRG